MKASHLHFQLVMAVLPKSEQIVFLQVNGRLHEDHMSKVVEMGLTGCLKVHYVLDNAIRDHLADTMATRGDSG